ncbi:MAG TPA: SDR family oxidoreductase [Candidatus Binataceae bacterium]|jgi:NAD(P)-dependent dehydrogenase (short-subunit alcohol dehydrogenase family)|nr:SDR family oxidoreductase [Candidatus Binataceae bacterium]
MSELLSGKVALVTGGASGIARATVASLLKLGAAVAILDRDEAGIKEVAEQGRAAGGNTLEVPFDLTNLKAIPDVVAQVVQKMGRIDILINAAGVAGRGQPLLKLNEEDWDLIHTVNLKAPMLLMKHVAKHMIDRGGGGRIVNISSSSAFRARNSPVAYASSKAAIVQLTRSAAAELAQYDINVNAVAPGFTITGMTRALGGEESFQRAVSSGPLENLFHRPSQPEDVAEAIVFLCLPGSRQINAQTIHTSAGAVIR